MSDGFTATLDASGFLSDLHRFGDTIFRQYIKPECKVTAESIQQEAQRRVRRSQAAETAKGIQVFEMHNGEGYVVVSINKRMPNLPLWIEAGTKQGKPRSHTEAADPYFYPAVRLEEPQHERRIVAAYDAAASAAGLG